MSGHQSTPTRRGVLSAVGTTLAAGAVGTAATGADGTDETATRRAASRYLLAQGEECVPVRPIRGRLPVETFYDYQLPEAYVSDDNGGSVGDAIYGSAGTADLQRPRTSVAFLYRGPTGLSLVVVHGSLDSSAGGSATFRISGLPESGEWVVKDDRYRDPDGDPAPSNYDRWEIEGTDHRIDWTWGSGGTDGGAFRGLGDDFEVVAEPAFGDAAALAGKHYEGRVTDWEFLSGPETVSERVSLAPDEPIRLTTGECERGSDDEDGTEESRGNDEETDADEEEENRDDESEHDEDDDANRDEDSEHDDEESNDGDAVCHRPPGNPDDARTIRVGSESAVEAHLGHGDSRGPCGDG